MKRFHFSKWNLFVIVSIILLCVCLTPKELQNDTFYLIKLGDYLVHHGFDGLDHWTWVYQTTYTYPHILLCVVCYLIYAAFSFTGIYVATMLLYIIFGLSLYYIVSRLIKNRKIAGMLAILIVIVMAEYVTMRGQMVSYSLFLWEIYWLYELYRSGKKRYVVYLTVSSWLIAMTHGTMWLFTFVLYLPVLVEWVVSKIDLAKASRLMKINDKIFTNKPVSAKMIFVALLMSIAVGFLTPTLVCFTYPILTAFGKSQSYIAEHAPSAILDSLALCVSMVSFLAMMILTKAKVRVSHLCYICGLFVMALMAQRHIALFYALGIMFVGVVFEDALATLNEDFKNAIVSAAPKSFLRGTLVALVVIISGCGIYNNTRQHYLGDYFAPEGAIDYMKENIEIEKMRLFNHYNIGSYLMFEDIPVFIDSRSDLYQAAFSGQEVDVFDDYLKMVQAEDLGLLERYEVTHILDYVDDKLALRLTGDTNYNELYRDDRFVLFEMKK